MLHNVCDTVCIHVCRLEFSSVFGWHLIKQQHERLVITASEWDAMMVHQATSFPVIALPRGDSSLPQKVSVSVIALPQKVSVSVI